MKTDPNEPVNPVLKYRQEWEDRTDGDSLGMVNYTEGGLTKREYFSGLALQGLVANYLRENITGWNIKDYAVEAVALADALIEELNKE